MDNTKQGFKSMLEGYIIALDNIGKTPNDFSDEDELLEHLIKDLDLIK